MSEEEKEQLRLLIEEYEENYKQSKYEGNVEEYESLKNTHKLLKKVLNYIKKLQKKEEQSQEILRRIKIIYMVHTKDCELTLKDIKKWEKMLDK